MNETDSPALPKLKIQGVPIVADYGWLYNFKTIEEALEYVEDVSLSVGTIQPRHCTLFKTRWTTPAESMNVSATPQKNGPFFGWNIV